MPYSIQQTQQIPNDPPQMGAKSTTTSNHHITPHVADEQVCNYYNIVRYIDNKNNRILLS